jgi:hypothetical protein
MHVSSTRAAKASRHLSISQAAKAGDVFAGVCRLQICLCLLRTLPYAPSRGTTSCTGDVGATAGLLLHLCAAAAAVPQYSLQLWFACSNYRQPTLKAHIESSKQQQGPRTCGCVCFLVGGRCADRPLNEICIFACARSKGQVHCGRECHCCPSLCVAGNAPSSSSAVGLGTCGRCNVTLCLFFLL